MSRHSRDRSHKAQPPRPAAATPTASATIAAHPVRENSAPKGETPIPPRNDGPAHEQIAVRAYHLWEVQGRPDGCDKEHWLEAERQLQTESR